MHILSEMRLEGSSKPKLVLATVFLLFSCNSQKRYLDKSLEIMEKHAIYTNQIDWHKVREDSYKQLDHAENIEDVHGIIKEALRYLKDNGHSFLMPAGEYNTIKTKERPLPKIESEIVNDEIGYILVPGFTGTPNMAKNYAMELQENIKRLDQTNLKGWIVDLSENRGGNMWPMLLGLAPLLGEGTYGFFVDNKKNYNPWRYEKGKILIGDSAVLEIEDPYKIKNKDKKLAILIGKNTASSGEATLVSFIGKKNTMLFGVHTAGLTTGNAGFELKNGARLLLATTIFVDRNRKSYGKAIKPDYATFQAREDAATWIMD